MELIVARNPEADSTLPYLVRVPLGEHGLVLKTRDTWPRTAKVYCHRLAKWPADAEVLERLPVRVCTRRGPAVDLVLDRGRENRSQFVITQAKGREVIFWQSPRTTKQARPRVALPTRRAAGQVLDIVVDSGEKYAWAFTRQQATTTRRRLAAGDYAVELDGEVVAAVERKSLADLAGSLLSGRLTYAVAELAGLPRAAVVVEDRYSALFRLEHVEGGRVAEALAETQARFPGVPVMFAETRPLAQEWSYRFLGAALVELAAHASPSTGLLDVVPPPTPAEVRAWATGQGLAVSPRGRVPAAVLRAYLAAQRR